MRVFFLPASRRSGLQELLHLEHGAALVSIPSGHAHLVGRQAGWQILQDLWRNVQRGGVHCVCLSGEVGIGRNASGRGDVALGGSGRDRDHGHTAGSPRAAAWRTRRRPGYRLHTSHITPAEITHYGALPVTTVARTVADIAFDGLADDLVIQAVQETVARGLAAPEQLHVRGEARGPAVERLIERALDGVVKPWLSGDYP